MKPIDSTSSSQIHNNGNVGENKTNTNLSNDTRSDLIKSINGLGQIVSVRSETSLRVREKIDGNQLHEAVHVVKGYIKGLQNSEDLIGASDYVTRTANEIAEKHLENANPKEASKAFGKIQGKFAAKKFEIEHKEGKSSAGSINSLNFETSDTSQMLKKLSLANEPTQEVTDFDVD